MLVSHALTALLTTFVATASAAPRARQTQCNKYVLISVRGTYENQGPSIAFVSMINTTLSTLPQGVEYDAVYPASPDQTAYLGAEDVVRYIDSGLQSCPKQKYGLLGYSQGASALGIALRNYTDTSSKGYKAIKAILVVGNPYHVPNATINIDQNGTATTREYPGILFNNDPTGAIPDVFYNDGKLIDICYAGDIICGLGYPDANFIPNHLLYGPSESVQAIGSNFLIERLQKKKKPAGCPA